MAQDRDFPYTLKEWMRDVGRWQAATKVAINRQAPLLALAIGGAGRTIVDEIDDTMLVNGGFADFRDGNGPQHRTGIQLIFRALDLKFPANQEAMMLKAGLEFFAFTPQVRHNAGTGQ